MFRMHGHDDLSLFLFIDVIISLTLPELLTTPILIMLICNWQLRI